MVKDGLKWLKMHFKHHLFHFFLKVWKMTQSQHPSVPYLDNFFEGFLKVRNPILLKISEDVYFLGRSIELPP